MKKINDELSRIQKELKAPKGKFNAFGKYKYRSCEDILEAVKPLLGNNTLVVSDEVICLGNRFYIKATAKFSDGETSIEVTGLAREPESKKGMDDAQVSGSTSSYARKYALNGLFCIDDNKDADDINDGSDHKTPKPKPKLDANNLSEDQVMTYEMPFGKYKGLNLKTISAQQTESGVSKGIEWLEWFCEQETNKEELKYTQSVVERFLNEILKQRTVA